MKRSSVIILVLFVLGLALALGLSYLSHFRVKQEATAKGPQRILCAVPNVAEIVFALGQGDRVAGVSDFTTYPPEAAAKEKIGGYINPNLERIIALQPDLVIVIGLWEKLSKLCEEKGIPLMRMEIEDLAGLYASIGTIGEALGCEAEARQLVEEIKGQLDEVRKKAAAQPLKPKVFLCMSRLEGSLENLSTVGTGGFLGELIEIAGGVNLFADVTERYPSISKEALMRRMPEVIVELRPEDVSHTRPVEEIKADWLDLPMLPAVATNRVYVVTDDYIKIAGPRIGKTAERLYELFKGAP